MEQGRVQTLINGGLLLTEYKEGIRFGTDALLLASFAGEKLKKGKAADFGTGSGVLPLLLLQAGCKATFTPVEIQEKYALLAEENLRANGFEDKASVLCGDLREYRTLLPSGGFDHVISNPPYLPANCGRRNVSEEKRIAWHDDLLSPGQLARAASWALKPGGLFFCVYLPGRLAVLLHALREVSLEPKRLRFISPSLSEAPSLVLLEAKKDAAEGMAVLPPLALYTDQTHTEQSKDLQEILRSFAVE